MTASAGSSPPMVAIDEVSLPRIVTVIEGGDYSIAELNALILDNPQGAGGVVGADFAR